jgi:hypothetical protein
VLFVIGCDFHPEARGDLDEIWEFVSASADAADLSDRRNPFSNFDG